MEKELESVESEKIESDSPEIETKAKRLTESDWLVVTSLWERGEVTLRDLSEKFKVSEAALSQGFKRRGVKRGSKAHLTIKEIQNKQKEEREKLIEEIFNFKKKFLRYGDFLMSLTMNEITEAKKSGEKLFTRKNEIETIIAATKVYKTIRNDMFHLYDLYDKDNQLPEELDFNIGVYTQEDMEVLRKTQEEAAKQFQVEPDDDEEDDEVIVET